MNRKIFNFDNITESKIVSKLNDKNQTFENSISACGCLFYQNTSDGKKLLLISYQDPNWPNLDDFGGRIDDDDKSVFSAIVRETTEETNNIINDSIIKKEINNRYNKGEYKVFYNKKSKYYVTLIEVDNTFFPNSNIFGKIEKHDNINRVINWYFYKDVKNKLANRLRENNELLNFLNN